VSLIVANLNVLVGFIATTLFGAPSEHPSNSSPSGLRGMFSRRRQVYVGSGAAVSGGVQVHIERTNVTSGNEWSLTAAKAVRQDDYSMKVIPPNFSGEEGVRAEWDAPYKVAELGEHWPLPLNERALTICGKT